MFKQSRRKIVVAIMSILVVIWIGTLCSIYLFSYHEVTEQNRQMLNEHLAQYRINMAGYPIPQDMGDMHNFPGMPQKQEPVFQDKPSFKLATFYSVAVGYDGEVLEIRNQDTEVYTDGELEELATELLEGKKNSGIKNNLLFSIVDKSGYVLIGFMDNTIMQEGMMTLFRYTLLIGAVVIIALYFVARYLARKIVEPLEESYEKQKQFVSDAGHELKTPVSVVGANAELLSREIGDNKWLANIQYENERMGKLVGQLLELARTENVKPQLDYLDLSRLVAGGVLSFESVAFEKGLTLTSKVADDIIVYGNSTQLSQLVSILVDNAFAHSLNGKEVQVSLSQTRGMAVLSVVNDGEPIPQEKMEHLFERFYRADEARNGEDKHYGLGLAIAKSIVEVHHGKIEVSCNDGKVNFSVRFPKNIKIK